MDSLRPGIYFEGTEMNRTFHGVAKEDIEAGQLVSCDENGGVRPYAIARVKVAASSRARLAWIVAGLFIGIPWYFGVVDIFYRIFW